jgi:hypothetical protein
MIEEERRRRKRAKFDEMVADGRMSRPKRVGDRMLLYRLKIKAASNLRDDNRFNPLDRMFWR